MLQAKGGDLFISDWLRNRNTAEFLGIWESVYNVNFNYGEFAIIKIQERSCFWVWLMVLYNPESINAMLIHQGVAQNYRLIQLHQIAVTQMKSLVNAKAMKELTGKTWIILL